MQNRTDASGREREYSAISKRDSLRNQPSQEAFSRQPVKLSLEITSMLRSRSFLGVSGLAAVLSIAILPLARQTADALTGPSLPVAISTPAVLPAPLPGMRPVSLAISPTHVADLGNGPARTPHLNRDGEEKAQLAPKPRRLVKEGCETPVSGLAGPEARRMVPGRCLT
ncbi:MULTISPECIES: hypothetical protein [Methylobacterium]|nr:MULTISPECIES: hypothetical protein [Methylobacterium]